MKSKRLMPKTSHTTAIDLYADKSALVLYWLIVYGQSGKDISVRSVARITGVSLGLVQRVFESLTKSGVLATQGLRTSKVYMLKNPALLLQGWFDHYDILKKCKVWTYDSGFSSRKELLDAIKESTLKNTVTLALHSASQATGAKNTNLETLELYIHDLKMLENLEKKLLLTPKERGYQVLVIKPFYKAILAFEKKSAKSIAVSPALLSVLDLFQFPLRGREQAEQIIQKTDYLRKIYAG